MRIVNIEEFMNLPKGTVYSKYEPCIFNGLMIKRENSGLIDFFYADLIGNVDCQDSNDYFDKCDEAQKSGISLKLDFEIMGRDGMFDKNQLFAVYEKYDVENLIKSLKGDFNNAYDK